MYDSLMEKYFLEFPEVLAVISEKEDGSMKIFRDGRNRKNRDDFFLSLGIDTRDVLGAEQIHSPKVEIVSSQSPEIVRGVDALVTQEAGIFLSVTVADCVPVFFYETDKRIVGIAHAGWRGISEGIVGNTITRMMEFGGDLAQTHIALGPGIGTCHFEIGEDVAKIFSGYEKHIIRREEKIYADLKKIIFDQAEAQGVDPANMALSDKCTFCDRKYFSYRRDRPEEVKAMVAVIGIRPAD